MEFRNWFEGLYHKTYNPTGTNFGRPTSKKYDMLSPMSDFAQENPHSGNLSAYLDNIRRVLQLFHSRAQTMYRKAVNAGVANNHHYELDDPWDMQNPETRDRERLLEKLVFDLRGMLGRLNGIINAINDPTKDKAMAFRVLYDLISKKFIDRNLHSVPGAVLGGRSTDPNDPLTKLEDEIITFCKQKGAEIVRFASQHHEPPEGLQQKADQWQN